MNPYKQYFEMAVQAWELERQLYIARTGAEPPQVINIAVPSYEDRDEEEG